MGENFVSPRIISNGDDVKVYSVLGKPVINQSFESKEINDIYLSKFISKGVYIVQVKTAENTLTKKIVID